MSGLVAHDADGNTLSRSTGLGGTVTVTRTSDTTGPVLVSARATPITVTATTGDATTTIALHATDNLAGVVFGQVEFTSPDGSGTATGYVDGAPDSGTAQDGTWNVDVTVPARSQAGTWTLTSADLSDAQGNDTAYDADRLPPAASFQVTTTADTVAPTLTAFTVGPARAPIVDGAVRVAGRFTVNDAVSGFGSATISFKGPDGSVDPANTVVVSDPSQYAVSGTTLSGTITFTAVLAAPATGAWSIAGVDLADLEGNTRTYSAAQLGTSTTFTVAAGTPDTQGPTLSALTITPSVDTTAGPRAVTVRITTSDTDPLATGLLSGSVDLASSDGSGTLHFEFDGDLPVAGDYENGTYADTETLGRYARGGTWVVTDVDLWDAAQNEHDYPQNALPAALGRAAPTLTVTSATDTDAPHLTSVSADASQADVSGGNPVHVHVNAPDNTGGSGLAGVEVTLSGPDGRTARGQSNPDTVAPGGAAGVDVYLPQYNSTGTWTITGVAVTDASGNRRNYAGAGIAGLPGSHAIGVTGIPDSSAPQAAGLALSPRPVDTTSGPVDADVLVRLTDATSGVDHATITLTSPHQAHVLSADLHLIAGAADDGWWQGTVSFPRYAETGTWTAALAVTDAAGNAQHLSAADLGNATLAVTGPPDQTAPVLSALAVSPGTVDTTRGPQAVTFTATASDTGSGVAGGRLDVTAPGGQTHAVDLTRTDDGTAATATLSATLPVPGFSAAGVWTIDQATVTDRYGQVASYNRTQLSTAGFANSFTTVGALDTTGPALTSLALQTTTMGAPGTVVGALAVTDSQSGFASGTVVFTGPDGEQLTGRLDAADISDGTATDGTVPMAIDVPADTAPVTMTLSEVDLVDASGNETRYTADTFPAAGVDRNFTVAAPSAPSTTPPVRPDPPAAPTAVGVTAGDGTATVRWTAPSDDGGAPVTGYTVTGPGGAGCTTTGATSCTVSRLVNGRAYAFAVHAVNTAGAGPAASAPSVVPRAATRLRNASVTGTVTYGARVTVTGALTRADTGRGIAGATVRLQWRPRGSTGSFTTIATAARTTASGAVTFGTFAPGYAVEVRLTYPTAGAYAGSTSSARVAAVRRSISAAAPSTARHGHRFTVHGTVSPAVAGVRVYLQQRSGSRWVTVAGATLHSRSYSFSVLRRTRATLTYRVTTSADSRYTTSVSAARRVQVR